MIKNFSFSASRVGVVFLSLPLVLLILLIIFNTLGFVSQYQRLALNWLRTYEFIPQWVSHLLLFLHVTLTPGLALLVFCVFALIKCTQKKKFLYGVAGLIYYPCRIYLLFILSAFFPLFLIFDLTEAWILFKLTKRSHQVTPQSGAPGA